MISKPVKSAISIKGYAHGLLVTLGEDDWEVEQEMLLNQISGQGSFFKGAQFAVNVGCRTLRAAEIDHFARALSGLGVSLNAILSDAPSTVYGARMLGIPTSLSQIDNMAASHSNPGILAMVIREPCEPGTTLTSKSDLVVIGDVPQGVHLEAQGSILIWGRLYGSVHAGNDGNTGVDVSALVLKPQQLLIAGMVYTPHIRVSGLKPETARICGGNIIIESWHKRKPRKPVSEAESTG
jgi:septum site-determining protein MinC